MSAKAGSIARPPEKHFGADSAFVRVVATTISDVFGPRRAIGYGQKKAFEIAGARANAQGAGDERQRQRPGAELKNEEPECFNARKRVCYAMLQMDVTHFANQTHAAPPRRG